jgi:uncharacterized membrane-anchored protein
VQLKHVPSFGTKYWTALVLASIFGANTGDFLSDSLGLGHIAGLPILAALFALVLIAERFDSFKHTAYFWSAIIIIRTSATNIGDIGHDLRLKAPLVIAAFALALLTTILLWQAHVASKKGNSPQGSNTLSTTQVYWFGMLLAGALGTVVGDYFSFGLKLGTLNAALALGAPLALIFFLGRNGLLTNAFYYFLTVVFIRAAGTAAGDFVAHRFFGLPLSTLISGIVFVAFLVLWREKTESVSSAAIGYTTGTSF